MPQFSCPAPAGLHPSQIASHPGISLKDGRLIFSKDWTTDKAAEVVETLDRTRKVIDQIEVKAFKPTDDDRAEVRKRLRNPDAFDLTKFGFYEVVVADTRLDFTREKISKPVLDALALQAIDGVSILVNHMPDNVIGHSFAGDVVPIPGFPGEYQFVSKFYVPDDSVMPNGQNAVRALDSGIWKFISIGFRNTQVKFIEPENDPSQWHLVYLYDPQNPPVLVEYSAVYRGAQPGAMFKSEKGKSVPIFEPEKEPFQMKKNLTFNLGFLADGTRKSLAVEVDVPAEGATLTIPAEVQTEIDALANKAKEVDTLTAELKSVKAPVINEVQGLQKKLGLPEDTDAILSGASFAELTAKSDALKSLDSKQNPKNQVRPVAGEPVNESKEPTYQF
jgi:hypothetical protein